MEKLFPNEEILVESNNKSIILTNRRMIQNQSNNGYTIYKNIMLEHIKSCVNSTSHNIMYLILAGITLLISGYVYTQVSIQAAFVALIAVVVLVILYFTTRKNVLAIASPSCKIIFEVNNMKREKTIEFIYKIGLAIDSLRK